MEVEFTQHALRAMKVRGVLESWVLQAVKEPEHREPDPVDPELERFYAVVHECGDRVLRVVVNTHRQPWRIITAFPDRNMRGKL